MAYLPYAPRISDVYTLTGANGAVAVFNAPANSNYVGALTDITGLDSADVRESAEDLASADGGTHGNFYTGRRPIVMTALLYDHTTGVIRDTRYDKIKRASTALRDDAILSWVSGTSGQTMYVPVRRQQALRQTGNWVKEVQISLVSEFPYLYGTVARTQAGSPASCENQGDAPYQPTITVTGVTPSTVVTNAKNSKVLKFTAAAAGTIIVDTNTHTATVGGVNKNSMVDFVASTWPSVDSGVNSFTITGGGTLSVAWRDAWT